MKRLVLVVSAIAVLVGGGTLPAQASSSSFSKCFNSSRHTRFHERLAKEHDRFHRKFGFVLFGFHSAFHRHLFAEHVAFHRELRSRCR
jgi:hypothetical protein